MRKFVRFITAEHLLQAGLVAERFEVLMVLRHFASAQELDHARIGQRIEIAAQNQLNITRIGHVHVLRPQRLHGLFEDRLELVAQHHGLDKFHITEFRIPVDVRGTYQNRLRYELRIGWC